MTDPISANPAAQASDPANQASSGTDAPDPRGKEIFMYVFILLLSSMSTRQDTVMLQAKQLSTNASIQNQLNKLDADIRFSTLPIGAGTATINRVQINNQIRANQRENIQNVLITERLQAQQTMTEASTNINYLQQDAAEDSGWLQTLNTIFQVINSMTGTGN